MYIQHLVLDLNICGKKKIPNDSKVSNDADLISYHRSLSRVDQLPPWSNCMKSQDIQETYS